MILHFSGNYTSVGPSAARMRPFLEAGFGAAVLEYRGSSGSAESPSEEAFAADARALYDQLDALLGVEVPPERRVIHGFSLGSAVGARLAAERPVGAVVLEAAFPRVCEVFERRYRGAPLCRLMWRERYEVIARIGRITAPKLFLHGGRDASVPIAYGRRLYEAAPEPKEFIAYPAGQHANLLAHGMRARRHRLPRAGAAAGAVRPAARAGRRQAVRASGGRSASSRAAQRASISRASARAPSFQSMVRWSPGMGTSSSAPGDERAPAEGRVHLLRHLALVGQRLGEEERGGAVVAAALVAPRRLPGLEPQLLEPVEGPALGAEGVEQRALGDHLGAHAVLEAGEEEREALLAQEVPLGAHPGPEPELDVDLEAGGEARGVGVEDEEVRHLRAPGAQDARHLERDQAAAGIAGDEVGPLGLVAPDVAHVLLGHLLDRAAQGVAEDAAGLQPDDRPGLADELAEAVEVVHVAADAADDEERQGARPGRAGVDHRGGVPVLLGRDLARGGLRPGGGLRLQDGGEVAHRRVEEERRDRQLQPVLLADALEEPHRRAASGRRARRSSPRPRPRRGRAPRARSRRGRAPSRSRARWRRRRPP